MIRLDALIVVAAAGLCVTAGHACAEPPSTPVVRLVLENHKFSPATVDVPAGRRIRVELVNRDGSAEEFDSDDLHVEKDVAPHGKAAFTVGPLSPGTYRFMGELHADTASGELHALAPDAP
jgi:hypothetical protein